MFLFVCIIPFCIAAILNVAYIALGVKSPPLFMIALACSIIIFVLTLSWSDYVSFNYDFLNALFLIFMITKAVSDVYTKPSRVIDTNVRNCNLFKAASLLAVTLLSSSLVVIMLGIYSQTLTVVVAILTFFSIILSFVIHIYFSKERKIFL